MNPGQRGRSLAAVTNAIDALLEMDPDALARVDGSDLRTWAA